ncbi:MAG: roadblock/LC7 domain-containing protein [Desulfobacteraceae bacterium]|jgi:predicted regulator of Ras-like GTPase activity (Roadblock/LC7/MglB family)
MATRSEKITEILRGLRVSSPDIFGLAVISLDGFLIAALAPSEIDEELVAGMSAALLGVGERISGELMRAPMKQIFVKSEKGYVILNAVGEDSVLVLLVSNQAKLGLIFLELRRMVPELQKVL